jgi:hypothetical protein
MPPAWQPWTDRRSCGPPFVYDLAPQGWRKSPYGFRLVTGTIRSTAGVSTFDDAFRMLDTIVSGDLGQSEQR